MASATKHAPRVTKKAIDLRRPLTRMRVFYRSNGGKEERVIGHMSFAIYHLSFVIESWPERRLALAKRGGSEFYGVRTNDQMAKGQWPMIYPMTRLLPSELRRLPQTVVPTRPDLLFTNELD